MTIHERSNRFKVLAWLSVFAAVLLTLSVIILSGCTDTLKGDVNANVAPVVYFVNIPPDSSSFSHNPKIYWFGTDPDGQIEYYRYLICTFAEVGAERQEVLDWAADSAHDTSWTYVDVDPTQANPQTAQIVPLTADLDDPVRTFVDHWVLLQAFDDDGMGSVVAIKSLNRNDHAPATIVINTMKNDTPYVDAASAGGIVTGVKLTWQGADVQDYDEQGLIAPPFEFEWKLWGPYDTSQIDSIYSWFLDTVFYPVTQDAIYYLGDTMLSIDSNLVEDGDSVIWVLDSNLVIFDDKSGTNRLLGYYMDTLLVTPTDDSCIYFVDSFLSAQSWDGLDSWVWDTGDTLMNVYGHCDPSDSTRSSQFLFIIRSRDDALVPDPTPAFVDFPVIEPRFENDVLVIDFTPTWGPPYSMINAEDSTRDMRRRLFTELIAGWDDGIQFDAYSTDGDYVFAGMYPYLSGIPLHKLMRYKMMILYSDHVTQSVLGMSPHLFSSIYTAIDAGVNTWVTGRSMLVGSNSGVEALYSEVPPEIERYFGLEGQFFSSWASFFSGKNLFNDREKVRMEDFVGAYSLDESQWPNLDIDTAYLHHRYSWPGDTANVLVVASPWIDSIAALPEVNWCERRYGTEPMYLYKSKYGPDHPLGYPYAVEGSPVGIRYETSIFRTVWFQFSPWAIETTQMQDLANNVLDWLYDPNLGDEPVTEKRYPDALIKISIDEARQNFDARNAKYRSE